MRIVLRCACFCNFVRTLFRRGDRWVIAFVGLKDRLPALRGTQGPFDVVAIAALIYQRARRIGRLQVEPVSDLG